jgi:dethiobiotin synthase
MIEKLGKELLSYEKFYLIGTSTEVGKTFVGSKLYEFFLKNNSKIRPLKPLETGWEKKGGPDSLEYQKIAKKYHINLKLEQINFGNLEKPCSPHLSNQLENKIFKKNEVLNFIKQEKEAMIEFAGGLLVPINEKNTQFDLIEAYPLPIVIVAHAGLGTLNHVLLTLKVLETIKTEKFIVLNFFEKGDLIHETNYQYLKKRYKTFILNKNT